MRKGIAAVLGIALLLSLSGAAASAAPREVVIGMPGDVHSMDPYTLNETINNALNNHLFDTLIETDNNLQPRPGLAESWEVSEDARTWIFHLRKGVTFHNGNPFTVDDVIYSFDRSKDRNVGASFVHVLSTVESYEKIDDHTLKVTCKSPNALLLAHFKDLLILNKAHCEGQGNDWIALNPNGTGRYKLVEHVRGDRLVFERNPSFWGEQPIVEKVTFKPITNEGTRTANMLSGAVDLVVNVPVRDVKMLEKNKNVTVISQPGLRAIYLNMAGWTDTPSKDAKMPLKSPDGSNPFKDIRVREAMYRAINIDEIVEKIMNGFAKPMATYSPEGYNGFNPDVKRLAYDPALAEKLLDEAGYKRQSDGYRFEVTLDAPNDRYINDGPVATAIAGYFEKVGIKVNPNLMSRSVFFSYISTTNKAGDNTHLCMTGWSDSGGESALIGLDMLYSIKQDGEVKPGYGGVNRGFYCNPEVDKLIDEAISTGDPTQRGEIMKKAWQLAADDVSYIPLYFEVDLYAYGKKINYTPRKDKYVFAWDVSFND